MALIVYAAETEGLLSAIKTAIDQKKVDTWSYDSDGDFVLAADTYRRAWFRPRVDKETVTFTIFPPRDTTISRGTYAEYHSEFLSMLLSHFDLQFRRAVITALPHSGDRIKAV